MIKGKNLKKLLTGAGLGLAVFCLTVVLTFGGTQLVSAAVKKNSVKKYTVTLCKPDGKIWKKINFSGKKKFPSADTRDGNMFLGWSRSKNKTKKPSYYADDIIPRKNAVYYMVTFRKNQDKASAKIRRSSNYDRVWFVGDSRFLGMKHALGKTIPSNVGIICKGGKGLGWFRRTGFDRLLEQVKEMSVESRMAVVINLGVNDLNNYSEYPNYMKKVSEVLTSYGCDMYYMSVNPVNSAMIRNYRGYYARTEKQIRNINKMIYNKLCSGSNKCYTYVDTNNYLRRYGWISNNKNDGVHYSDATYKRIYDYCIRCIG